MKNASTSRKLKVKSCWIPDDIFNGIGKAAASKVKILIVHFHRFSKTVPPLFEATRTSKEKQKNVCAALRFDEIRGVCISFLRESLVSESSIEPRTAVENI